MADLSLDTYRLLGRSGLRVSPLALVWTLVNPAVTAPIVGARTLSQLEQNLAALDVRLTEDQLARLEAASAIELGFPHDFLTLPMVRNVVFGEARIVA